MLPDHQLDLFDAAGHPHAPPETAADRPRIAVEALDDRDLIAAIPVTSLKDCHALAGEAVRRHLDTAVPALEALCRRFSGFGLGHTLPEQAAALRALAGLGGTEAAAAVARIIAADIVQGPGLIEATRAAVVLRCRLPAEKCLALLHHRDPAVRADAASLAYPRADIIVMLVDLLEDLNGAVAKAAACALGRMGHRDGRAMLIGMLREDPSPEVIDAVAAIADEQVIVMLGRIARTRPDLTRVATMALDDIEDPRAATLARALREGSSG
jgi:hypothetical protein